MGKKIIYFNHIPKTGSTSLNKSFFLKNINENSIHQYFCIQSLVTDRSSFRYVFGHQPYGIHRFVLRRHSPMYFVMLRDPVKRAISFYYECLEDREERGGYHPEYSVASSHSIEEFYSIPRFQNVQTRMIAGIAASRIGRKIPLDRLGIGSLVLRLAKYHLENCYDEFGLTESLKESIQLFASRLGWKSVNQLERKLMANPERPTHDDLSEGKLHALRRANKLDIRLFEFAQDLFHKRILEHKQ